MNRSRLPSPQENPPESIQSEILPVAPVTGHARAHSCALKQGGTAKFTLRPCNKGDEAFFLSPGEPPAAFPPTLAKLQSDPAPH